MNEVNILKGNQIRIYFKNYCGNAKKDTSLSSKKETEISRVH